MRYGFLRKTRFIFCGGLQTSGFVVKCRSPCCKNTILLFHKKVGQHHSVARYLLFSKQSIASPLKKWFCGY